MFAIPHIRSFRAGNTGVNYPAHSIDPGSPSCHKKRTQEKHKEIFMNSAKFCQIIINTHYDKPSLILHRPLERSRLADESTKSCFPPQGLIMCLSAKTL